MNLPDHLQLENCTLMGILWQGADLAFILDAESYDGMYCHNYEARIIITSAELLSNSSKLPSEIIETEIVFPHHSSYSVFIQLPFSISLPCKLSFGLVSGESVCATGDSCRVELVTLLSSRYLI
jgi:hypothetical protein